MNFSFPIYKTKFYDEDINNFVDEIIIFTIPRKIKCVRKNHKNVLKM